MLVCFFAVLTFSTVDNGNENGTSAKKPTELVLPVADSLCSKMLTDGIQSEKKDTVELKSKNIGPTYTGLITWYGPRFHGKKTASGQVFNKNTYSAATLNITIPGLKLGKTKARITNLKTGKSIVVCINDRGSRKTKYLLDLSEAAFAALGDKRAGNFRAKIEIL